MENSKLDATLMKFFNKKRLIFKKMKLNKQKTHTYEVYNDRFVLKNIETNQEDVFVKRIPKEHLVDLIEDLNKKQNEISNILLKTKYEFLYDYKPIEYFEETLKTDIEPNELKYKDYENMKQKYLKLKEKIDQEIDRKIEEKKLEQNVFKEDLKELQIEDNDKKKEDSLIEYIKKEKEIYELMTLKRDVFKKYEIDKLNDESINEAIDIEVINDETQVLNE